MTTTTSDTARLDLPAVTLSAVTIDCADALATATFWSQLCGLPVAEGATADSAALDGGPISLCFVAVPEPKATKNRLHLDLGVESLADAVAHAASLGARVQTAFDGWSVLVDPFGNEFCLVG